MVENDNLQVEQHHPTASLNKRMGQPTESYSSTSASSQGTVYESPYLDMESRYRRPTTPSDHLQDPTHTHEWYRREIQHHDPQEVNSVDMAVSLAQSPTGRAEWYAVVTAKSAVLSRGKDSPAAGIPATTKRLLLRRVEPGT